MERGATKKLTVLIVDDSLLITERLIELLNDMDNIRVVTYAENYKEGLRLLKRIKPDIVLLDIILPDKSGIELLKDIHQQPGHPKVIMITNQATDYHKRTCSALGADYFFDKSNEFDQIPIIIANIQLN